MTARLPAGAGILVTRPKRQSTDLMATIRDAGGEPILFPALAIEPVAREAVASAWAELPTPDIVLFISANAARYSLDAIDLPETAVRLAVGPATAAELAERGATAQSVEQGGFDSEHLLQTPELTDDIGGKTVTIVRGEGGRALLGTKLSERGATVNYLEVYRRLCPEADAQARRELLEKWQAGQIRAVTALSEATLANLRQLIGARGEAMLNDTPLVSPSRRLLQNLESTDYRSTAGLAESPDAATIVAKVAEILAANNDGQTMNESSRDTDNDDAGAAAPADPVAEIAASSATEVSEPPPANEVAVDPAATAGAGGGASFQSWLALVLSAIALGLSGFLFWQSLNTTSVTAALQPLETRIDAASSAARAAGTELENLGGEQQAIAAQVSDLSQTLASRQDLLDSLPGRVQNVETSIGAMQGIAAGSRDGWLRAEAEYYMQLANAQLQLARNPGLAAVGLELADERIRELANPTYTPVRRALAEEIQALKATGGEDLEGVSLQLAGLAQTVALLPLRQEIALPEATGAVADETAPTGTKRALAAVKSVLTDLVDVRRTDEALEPLMSPQAAYFLRINLELKFDVARLALLRGEQVDYEQSLDDAASWIGEYFDMESEGVRAALATIADIRERELSTQFPDIAGSLKLLRQRAALEELDDQ